MLSNFSQSLLLLLNFFSNQYAVNTSPECTFECNMRSWSTHKSNKVVVLLGWKDIRAQVSNGFGVNFCGCIKPKTNWDVFILQITINCLWCSNNFALWSMLLEVFRKKASVCVGVITTDNNETIEIKCVCVCNWAFELIWFLNLMSSRS